MSSGFTFGTSQTGGPSGIPFGSSTATSGTTQAPASTSFSFGVQAAQSKSGSATFGQQSASASFNFGTPQQQTTSAFMLGQASAPTNQAQNTSLNFNTAQPTQQVSSLGSTLGQQPASQTTPSVTSTATSLTLGGTTTQSTGFQITKPATTLSSGFSLAQSSPAGGFALRSTPAKTNTTASASVSFNLPSTAATSGSLNQGHGATTATSGGGLTLSQPAATSGATNPLATTGGFSLSGSLSNTTATVKPTLTLEATSSASSSVGGLGGTATTTATGLFGTSSTTTPSSSQSTGIFAAPTTSVSTGLGGVDPQTTSSGGGGVGGTASKVGDNKTVKETPILNEIQVTVNDFKKYVKNQKTVRENIARMSSTPLFKVQEEVVNLKQLLSVVSNGLQRNSVAIEKLKQESAEELKHAEIAHRTKETPLGLQYEHTAPTEYFQHLANGFESQMIFFRQQIEEMENYLNSLNLGATLTPQEVSQILTKLHETFIALAGQLRIVHEAVQVQKDHYLNYRRIFLADNTDVFEKRRKTKRVTSGTPAVTVGPTPFTTPSNAAIVAMASTLNRNQQAGGLGLNATAFGTGQLTGLGTTGPTASTGGLLGNTSGIGFGQKATTATQSGGFGTSFNLGTSSGTATVQPLGSTGLFGSASTQPANIQSTGSTSFGFGNMSAFGAQNPTGQTSFQLQNPPPGSKRGKKA